MTWTSEPPTAPGLYWFRAYPGHGPCLVRVEYSPRHTLVFSAYGDELQRQANKWEVSEVMRLSAEPEWCCAEPSRAAPKWRSER